MDSNGRLLCLFKWKFSWEVHLCSLHGNLKIFGSKTPWDNLQEFSQDILIEFDGEIPMKFIDVGCSRIFQYRFFEDPTDSSIFSMFSCDLYSRSSMYAIFTYISPKTWPILVGTWFIHGASGYPFLYMNSRTFLEFSQFFFH